MRPTATGYGFSEISSDNASRLTIGYDYCPAATNANYVVSQAFGISDVVGILPANTFGVIPNDATGQYALYPHGRNLTSG